MSRQSGRGPAPHGHVTLADVARAAGVSAQSVSNALHRPEKVAEKTRAQILAAVDRLGYRPNRSARALRSRRTHVLAVSVLPSPPDRAAPLLDQFLHALSEAANRVGNHVLLCRADDQAGEVAAFRDLLTTTSVDAVVLTGSHRDDERIAALRQWGVPFATFGRSWDGDDGVPWVDVDGRAGLHQATTHLAEQGHRVIGHLGWPDDSDIGHDRRLGWLAGCAAAGLAPGPEVSAADAFQAAYDAALRLLADERRPTAVACSSDTLALGVLRAAVERGLVVGRDLAVTGFDDSPAAALTTPPITSLRQPLEQVAQHLVAAVEDLLTGESERARQTLLRPRLVIRDSSRFTPEPASVDT